MLTVGFPDSIILEHLDSAELMLSSISSEIRPLRPVTSVKFLSHLLFPPPSSLLRPPSFFARDTWRNPSPVGRAKRENLPCIERCSYASSPLVCQKTMKEGRREEEEEKSKDWKIKGSVESPLRLRVDNRRERERGHNYSQFINALLISPTVPPRSIVCYNMHRRSIKWYAGDIVAWFTDENIGITRSDREQCSKTLHRFESLSGKTTHHCYHSC